MNIERVRIDEIKDVQVKNALSELLDCIFELDREYKRLLGSLTSQNVKAIDCKITKIENIDSILTKYATKAYVNERVGVYEDS